ncbi:DUF6332 family protein [Streptomyces longwoodensis]|uniref:DUF6332 family protein n=1 Tax=Streptomyces longwoodensis TaxID=68231 RepID=UPI00386AC642
MVVQRAVQFALGAGVQGQEVPPLPREFLLLTPRRRHDLPAPVERSLKGAAVVIAPVLFLARVVTVLVRFRRGAQPSQPGRTNPDS